MWDEGTLLIDGTSVKYWVKHYAEPSEDYGIDGGRISKMELRVGGRTTLNYAAAGTSSPRTRQASSPTRLS